MKIYRNSYRDETYEHKGYSYHTTPKEAKRAADGINVETEILEVRLTKAGVIELLKRCGSHPDNG